MAQAFERGIVPNVDASGQRICLRRTQEIVVVPAEAPAQQRHSGCEGHRELTVDDRACPAFYLQRRSDEGDAVAVEPDRDGRNLIRREAVPALQCQDSVHRRMGVAAGRIGLYPDPHRLPHRAKIGDRTLGARGVAVALEEAVSAFQRIGRPLEPIGGEARRHQTLHGSLAHLIALVPGAVLEELERTRRLAGRDPEGVLHRARVEAQQPPRRGRRAEGACSGGGMEAARIVRGRVQRHAEAAADLEADDDRRHQRRSGCICQFSGGDGGRHDRRARMQRTVGMGVIEIERMAERAVQQRCRRRAVTTVEAEHGAGAVAAEPETLHHRQDREAGIGLVRRSDARSNQVRSQRQRARRHLGRYLVHWRRRGEFGQNAGACHEAFPK